MLVCEHSSPDNQQHCNHNPWSHGGGCRRSGWAVLHGETHSSRTASSPETRRSFSPRTERKNECKDDLNPVIAILLLMCSALFSL